MAFPEIILAAGLWLGVTAMLLAFCVFAGLAIAMMIDVLLRD